MRKCLLIIFAILAGFLQAQTKKQTSTTRQKTEKKWINPVKLTKEERNRPYMDEVLKTLDSLTPQEAERRRKNIAIGNPFAKYGYYPKIATLSKGKYLEFHDMDSIVKIGSVRFNRKTKSITEFREIDLSDPDAQPYLDTAGRWISPDPLSEEFPSWTPYNFVFNNPLKFTDPDGRAPEEVNCCWWLRLMPLFEESSIKPTIIETVTKTGEAGNKQSEALTKTQQEHFNRGRRIETEQIDKMNEEGRDVVRNTKNYEATDPKTGDKGGTRPDGFTKDGNPVEIKNVRKQALTKQLRFQDNLVEGKRLILRINNKAELTQPLKDSGIDIQPYNVAPPIKIDNTRTQPKPAPIILPRPVKKDACAGIPNCI